jgi:hypothetical protein
MLTPRIDAQLIQLGDELEIAWADERRICQDETSSDAKVARACDRVASIVDKIEATQASSIEGLRVKARAIAWCHGDKAPIALTDKQTTDVRLAQAIIADLLAS